MRIQSSTPSSITRFLLVCVCSLCGLLIGCQSNPNVSAKTPTSIKKPADTPLIHIDSTRYLNSNKASVSMRASVLEGITANNDPDKPLLIQPLAKGYKIQFRSITTEPTIISNVAIIAGGKNFSISKGFSIPKNKGITLSLSLGDSLLVQQYDDAILRFEINQTPQIISVKNHKLYVFDPLHLEN